MRQIILGLSLYLVVSIASAAEGMISVTSVHSVAVTADRLESVLAAKGMTVFARIDHAAGAAKVGKELAPTELIIFGNPKIGSGLMQCGQSIAIDLPQKALIWEDAKGVVRLSYNDPRYLDARHDLKGCDDLLEKVAGALGNFAKKATTQ